jgi:hypothetical protein
MCEPLKCEWCDSTKDVKNVTMGNGTNIGISTLPVCYKCFCVEFYGQEKIWDRL